MRGGGDSGNLFVLAIIRLRKASEIAAAAELPSAEAPRLLPLKAIKIDVSAQFRVSACSDWGAEAFSWPCS
jgi:hypothetical protein